MNPDKLIPKAVGADIELGILAEGANLSQLKAARKVLEKVPGIPSQGVWNVTETDPEEEKGILSLDLDRKWLEQNGASIYIDCAHPEMAHPICRSARDFVAVHRSLLSIMEDALEETNADLEEGRIRRTAMGRILTCFSPRGVSRISLIAGDTICSFLVRSLPPAPFSDRGKSAANMGPAFPINSVNGPISFRDCDRSIR